jgi:hypothetical protein
MGSVVLIKTIFFAFYCEKFVAKEHFLLNFLLFLLIIFVKFHLPKVKDHFQFSFHIV